jgi:hypothetical protein
MTTMLNGRTPAFPEDDEAAFGSVVVMFMMVQRSNHATAFAGWVVATSAMGLVVELGTIQAASPSPLGVLLAAALVPVLGSTGLVLALLVRAHCITSAAQEDFYRFIAETPRHAPELRAPAVRQLQLLTAATRHREMLTRRALTWSYVSGIAFLTWSAAAAMAFPAWGGP